MTNTQLLQRLVREVSELRAEVASLKRQGITYMSASEYAAKHGITRQTVGNRIRSGSLNGELIGGKLFVAVQA